MFDARCFNIPKEEVTNLIYWRQVDAARNSVQMVGQANFSHTELQDKTCNMIQDMLHEQRGINWNDYPTCLKRGTCVVKREITDISTERITMPFGEDEVTKTARVRTEWFIDTEIPIFRGEAREYIEKLVYCQGE
jgi:tRNA(His) 5'-end guanylyltransferase